MCQAKINNKNSYLSLLFYVLSANVFMRVFKSKVVVNYKILCVFGVFPLIAPDGSFAYKDITSNLLRLTCFFD